MIASPLVPNTPSSPNHLLDLALGAIVGLGLRFGLAYVRDRRDTGFHNAAELEEALNGIPVLGVIPALREEYPSRGDRSRCIDRAARSRRPTGRSARRSSGAPRGRD